VTTPATPASAPLTQRPASSGRWYYRLFGLLLALACFEIGLFLVAFPWSRYWDTNYFSWLSPEWHEIWLSPYLRGAVSGLGLVNLYVTLAEVFRLKDMGEQRAGTRQPE